MSEQTHDRGAELIAVAGVPDQVQAEMLKALLASAGVSSVLQPPGPTARRQGSGAVEKVPCRLLVKAELADRAVGLLVEALVEDEGSPRTTDDRRLTDRPGGRPGPDQTGAHAGPRGRSSAPSITNGGEG